MVSPGASSPSRSARSIMYLAIRALMDPEGLRYSSLAQIPSTMTRGVLPIASRIVPPGGRKPAAAFRSAPAVDAATASRASSAADVAFIGSQGAGAAGRSGFPVPLSIRTCGFRILLTDDLLD